MEYPHKKYIQYLISRRLERYEIMADCAAFELIPPNDVDLSDMFQEVGLLPTSWSSQIKGSTKVFQKWINELGVYSMWEQDTDTLAALGFLGQSKIRQSFESLVLLHGDVETARQELENTYPARRIPSISALETYCYYFWDVGSMSKPGLYDFLKLQQNQEFKLAALDGDIDYTYAMLGLRQSPNYVEHLDRFIQLAKLETMTLLRQGGIGSGQRAAGQAALMRATLDAISMRMELGQSSTGSEIRKEANLFKARIVQRSPKAIPSIDDLRAGDVIDAEFSDRSDAEEEDEGPGAVVHRLVPRGRPRKTTA